MKCTATAISGNAVSATTVRTGSRRNITTVGTMIVLTWRMAMTSTVDETWARRLMSFMIREIRSAECTLEKNASGMSWMCV